MKTFNHRGHRVTQGISFSCVTLRSSVTSVVKIFV
jgi:hypothetical protein